MAGFRLNPYPGALVEIRACRPALLACGLVEILVFALVGSASDYCAYNFPLDSNPTPIVSDDVCNFHQVDAQLYRGGRPRPNAYPKLVEIGIRTIISLEESEFAEDERRAIDTLNLKLPPEKQIQFLSFPIGPAEIDTKGVSDERLKVLFSQIRYVQRPIFMHCYHGKDRTGMVVVLYRLLMNQKSLPEAYEEAFRYRFSREDYGLSRTIDRYKSPKKLKALPHPEPEE